jgi:hypothetical protein
MNKLNISSLPVDVAQMIGKDDSGTFVIAGDRYFKRIPLCLKRCRAKDAKPRFPIVALWANHKPRSTTSLFMARGRAQGDPDKVGQAPRFVNHGIPETTEKGRFSFRVFGLFCGWIPG